ncbi:MAG: Bug family tripartite tricarboxylate transporter substrate binding protein [Rhodospirillaceae bacterium]
MQMLGRGLRPAAIAAVAAFAAALGAAGASAQSWPARPVHILIPSAPGGITDILARMVADQLNNTVGGRFVPENKPGAGGNVGVNLASKATPDGYTLIMLNVGQVTCNPWLYSGLTFDVRKELTGVAPVGVAPHLLAVNKDIPAKTAQEFIAYAKANPGKLNYSSAGNATMPHIVGEQFKRLFGVDMVHIPYRGSGPGAVGVGAGEVQATFAGLGSIKPQFSAGTVRVLGAVYKSRIPDLPDVPTFDELGLTGFDLINWFGLMAPAGTPPEVIAKINAGIKTMNDDPAVLKRYREGGIEALWESPETFNARIAAEYEKYGAVIKAVGMKIE